MTMIMMYFLDSKGPLTQLAPWGSINYDDDDDCDNDDDDDDDDSNDNDDDDDDMFSKNVFFVGLLQLKPYQSDLRCLKASVQINQGTRKEGLLAHPGSLTFSYPLEILNSDSDSDMVDGELGGSLPLSP